MFTGLIDHQGVISHIERFATALRVTVQTSFSDLALGESMAVDGVCLTVVSFEEGRCVFDLSEETLAKTHLSHCIEHQSLNLERAIAAGQRFGGHFVSGHCDALASVVSIDKKDGYQCIRFFMEDTLCLIEKGSMAVNGVSLTINTVTEQHFSVMVIPHTLGITNLLSLSLGDKVNVEYDMLMKMVMKSTQALQQVNNTGVTS